MEISCIFQLVRICRVVSSSKIQLPYRHIFVFDGGAVTSTRDARGAFATTTSRNIYRVVRRERLRQRE